MATATAARTATPQRGLGTLAGTGKLLRFQARRTRIYLIGWIAGLVGFSWIVAAGFPELYPTSQDRAEFALTVDSPAMRSMTGPGEYIDAYAASTGAMFAHQMILWTGAIAAVMFVLLITRLTRSDEETSRLEVIRSLPVGRRSDLAAALLLAAVVAVALGLLMALAVSGIQGVDADGALLYGLGFTAIGLTFAAVTAVAAQLASYGSSANGLAFGALAFTVLMSAIGSAQENWLLWLSPIGWAQLTYVFTPEQRWWPLAIAAGVSVLLISLAFALVAKRDFGLGMLPGRAGPPSAAPGLNGIGSLTFRLTRGLLWAAVITMLVLGAAYGSITGAADEMLSGLSDTQRELIDQGGGSVAENFSATIAKIDAFFAAIFGLLVIGRARKEETGGRGELLASAPIPRSGWPGSYLPAALLVSAVAAIVGGIGLALTGAGSMGDGSYFGKLLLASVVHIPAIWVMVALAFACFAWLPRAGWLRWLPWVYAFIVGYYGTLLELPDWARLISPFEHVGEYPAQGVEWRSIVVVLTVGAAITAVGYMGVRRRDLQFD
ncbi:ABC transporter permease [Glycomyces tarimensis]